jgi:hypothetical protein
VPVYQSIRSALVDVHIQTAATGLSAELSDGYKILLFRHKLVITHKNKYRLLQDFRNFRLLQIMPSYRTRRHVAGLQVAVVLRHVVMSYSGVEIPNSTLKEETGTLSRNIRDQQRSDTAPDTKTTDTSFTRTPATQTAMRILVCRTEELIKSRRMRWAGHVARMGEERGCIGSWWGNRRERDHWGDLGVDG